MKNLQHTLKTCTPEQKKRIIKECQITRQTFWNWSVGNTPVPFLAQGIITKILTNQ